MTNTIPALSVQVQNAGPLHELKEVRIEQRLGLPALCELSFDGVPAAADLLKIGKTMQVTIGGEAQTLFSGDITAVEYLYPPGEESTLRVRGYDVLHRLRKRQHVRAYPECSLKQLLTQLSEGARDNRLVGDDIRWPLMIQHQQTDLEFLAERAALAGRYPLARDQVIYLIPLSGLGDQPDVPLRIRDNLYEARIELNADNDCSAISVYGWESGLNGQPRTEEKTVSIGRPVDSSVDARLVGGSGERALINQGVPDVAHARALARAELERRKAGDVVVWGHAEGDYRLQPGMPVQLLGVAPAAAGRYILTSATHTFDYERGYTVEFSSEPPPLPPRSRCDVATLGLVLEINDPQNKGRVRVSLPGYNDVVTGWMPVLLPGAGRRKGFITLPDVGDRVLVVLTHEDPSQGIVLGGLLAPEDLPDENISGSSNNRYTWMTPTGQRIRMDRSREQVLIENGKGASIELVENEIIITAGRIDFRRSL